MTNTYYTEGKIMDKPKYTEPFSHPRWKDIPHPRIIGEEEITPEEEEKSRRFLEECIQRNMKLREEYEKNKEKH